MLQSLNRVVSANTDANTRIISAAELFHAAVNFLRRQVRIIALVTLAVLTLVGLYLFTAAPSYTAEATMIIDTRKLQMFQQQPTSGGDLTVTKILWRSRNRTSRLCPG